MRRVALMLLVMAVTTARAAGVESESWRNLYLVSPISYDAAREVAEKRRRPLDDDTLHWVVQQPAFAERANALYKAFQERERKERLENLRNGCETGRVQCSAA